MTDTTLRFNEIELNDTVYFYCSEDKRAAKGTVKKIQKITGSAAVFTVEWIQDADWMSITTSIVPYDRIFKSKERCDEYIKGLKKKELDTRMQQMSTMEQLTEFCINVIKSSKYSNPEIIKMVEKKYEELRGVR